MMGGMMKAEMDDLEIGQSAIISAGEPVPCWLFESAGGSLYFPQRVIVTRLEGSPKYRLRRADRECREQALLWGVPDVVDGHIKVTGKDVFLDTAMPDR